MEMIVQHADFFPFKTPIFNIYKLKAASCIISHIKIAIRNTETKLTISPQLISQEKKKIISELKPQFIGISSESTHSLLLTY